MGRRKDEGEGIFLSHLFFNLNFSTGCLLASAGRVLFINFFRFNFI